MLLPYLQKMNKKIQKSLFELTRNCRITTKELGKKLHVSQQSASYLINQLKKKKLIQADATIIDAVKLGLTNVIVGFNFVNFDPQIKKEVIDELCAINSVIRIEEAREGVDIIVEYCNSNLSAFNKTHIAFVHKFQKSIVTKFVVPVIVKHKYLKNYLVRKFEEQDILLCGDRKVVDISPMEMSVLNILIQHPNYSITNIARLAKCSVKTIMTAKKNLQKKEIIKGYTSIINYRKVGIRRYFLLLKLASQSIGDIKRLTEFARLNRNITELVKIIGNYDIMLTIETIKDIDIISEIRSEYAIEDYFIVETGNIQKLSYLPVLK